MIKDFADRRPIDPPPVIELRVVDIGSYARAEERDITCPYNAEFFLHATLEALQKQGTNESGPLLIGDSVASDFD